MDDMAAPNGDQIQELLYEKICLLEEKLEAYCELVDKLIMGMHGAVDNHTRTSLLGDLKGKYSEKLGGAADMFKKVLGHDPFEYMRDAVMDKRGSEGWTPDSESEFVESIVASLIDRFGSLAMKEPEVKAAVEEAVAEATGEESEEKPTVVVEEKSIETPKKVSGGNINGW